jgi:flagellar motor switch protein FliN/FliY
MADASHATRAGWDLVMHLPGELRIEIDVPDFRVRKALELKAGALVDTKWSLSTEVPLTLNGRLIAWAEFDVVNEHLAARVTELA